MGLMIEFRNVSKSYGMVPALDGVDFSVQTGFTFGYIGPNGAGKSTSLKIIVGLLKDYSGDVFIDGNRLKGEAVKKQIGYLPQDTGFQNWRSVEQILATFGLLSGIPKNVLAKKIDSALLKVNLLDVKKKKVIHLSGGMRQKLLFAQAILHDPDILVLDEPFNGLDPESRFHIKKLILDLKAEGKTIIFSSHILNDVEDIADLIGILNFGKIVKVGSPASLQDEFKIGNNIIIEFSQPVHDPRLLIVPGVSLHIQQVSGLEYMLILEAGIGIEEGLHKIMEAIIRNHLPVINMGVKRPSLEDVYMFFTKGGRA